MRFRALRRPHLLAMLAAVLVAGCGGGGGGIGNIPTPQPINRAPTITLLEPAANPATLDVQEAASMDVRFRADAPDGGEMEYVAAWDAGRIAPAEGTVAAGSEVTVTFTPPGTDGQCTVILSVSDGEASDSTSLAIDVVGTGVHPGTQLRVLSVSMSPNPVSPGGTAALTATVQNPEGLPLTYRWKSRHGHIAGSGETATWTAPEIAGVYGIYMQVTTGTDTAQAGVAATVVGPEGGVLGQYFQTYREKNVVYFESEAFRRTDPNINFSWMKLCPDPARLPSNGFGARWTGSVKCEAPGTYVFRVHVDDGARMRVMNDAGQWIEVIPNNEHNWVDHTRGAWIPEPPVPLQLDGGKWYPLELEYFEGAENAFIVLYWSVNGGVEEIVPQISLRPPT